MFFSSLNFTCTLLQMLTPNAVGSLNSPVSFIAVSRTIATGSMGQYLSKMNKSPVKWISESTWKECLQLSSSVTSFSGMCSDIAVNVAFWSKFSLSENPFQFLKEGNMDTDDSPAVVEGMKNVASTYIRTKIFYTWKKA